MMSIGFNRRAILNINGVDYHFVIVRIGKGETIDLLKNVGLRENSGSLCNIKKLIACNTKIITFADTESEKRKFHHLKNQININNAGNDKTLISKKVFRYIYGHKDDRKSKPFCIISFQNWVDIQKFLMKLKANVSFDKIRCVVWKI